MNIVKNLPLAITGLILAILSLGKIFTDFSNISFVIGSFLIFLIFLKFILYFDTFKEELNNVIALSTFGTFSMALMVLSTYVEPLFLPISYNVGFGIWVLGILIHMSIMFFFTKRYILNSFDIHDVFASWWIVYIGITMAAITAPAFNLSYGYFFFCFGFLLMMPTLILVTYRYIKFNEITDKNKPFICIYSALYSILTVGYVNSLAINTKFLCIIYIVSCAFYIFAIYQLIKFLFIEKLKFIPSFSAFTFPFVISAIASFEVYKLFKLNIINYMSYIQTIIALILVIFVLYKYLRFIFKINNKNQINE